jgi:hypothetical protein
MSTVRPSLTSSPNRIVATAFGAIYVLVGLLGFLVAGGNTGFISTDGPLLLGIFQINHLHNVAHLLIAGLSNVRSAKTVNGVVAAAYLLLGIVGFFIVDTPANILALNLPDHFLHLGSAIVLGAAAIGADKSTARVAHA